MAGLVLPPRTTAEPRHPREVLTHVRRPTRTLGEGPGERTSPKAERSAFDFPTLTNGNMVGSGPAPKAGLRGRFTTASARFGARGGVRERIPVRSCRSSLDPPRMGHHRPRRRIAKQTSATARKQPAA